jgi:hypothetical protein
MRHPMSLMFKGTLPALLVAVVSILAPSAYGFILAAPPPLCERVAEADAIVLGKIVSMAGEDLLALPSPKAPEKIRFRLAVIEVTEVLKGVKVPKTVRLGFPAPAEAPAGGGITIRPKGPRFGASFKIGQDGLFYLAKHHREDFFIAPRYFDFVARANANFDQDTALARYAAKVGAHVAAGLESKDPQERFLAAALLINRYRTFRGGSGKTEPIEARESKMILTALAEADWKTENQISPWTLFNQLGLSERDGWSRLTKSSAAQRYQAAQDWLRDHAGTYRILRIADAPRPGAAPGTSSFKGNKKL